MVWSQVYNPLSNAWLSTLCRCASRWWCLLGTLGIFHVKAHMRRYLWSDQSRSLIATIHLSACRSAWLGRGRYGAAYGPVPIGWIMLNVIFLYQLTNDRGLLPDPA